MTMPRETWDLDEWKRRARAGAAPPEVGVRKVRGVAVTTPAERVVESIITDGAVDRQNDTIAVEGWDFTPFMQTGGPWLWAHDAMQPVARTPEPLRVAGGRVVGRAQFPSAGVSETADLVYRLLQERIVSATSVGFKPRTWAYNERRGGIDFLEQELCEISFVSVPANSGAVVTAVKRLGGDPAVLGFDRILRLGPEGFGVQREQSCPAGVDCPNLTQAELCPAGKLCPAQSTARTSWGGRDEVLRVVDDREPRWQFNAAEFAQAWEQAVAETIVDTYNRLRGRVD